MRSLPLVLALIAVSPLANGSGYPPAFTADLPAFDQTKALKDEQVSSPDTLGLPSPERINQINTALSSDLSFEESTTRGAADVQAFNQLSPSVVLVLAGGGSGTGSVINSNGDVLTNWHVVGSEDVVEVIYRPEDLSKEVYGERVHTAKVMKVDQVSDLALLTVFAPKRVTPLNFASQDPQIGEDVNAIGHPLGLSWSYTKGIVTGVRADHTWRYSSGLQHKGKVIQTQTPINPGNSGGPLFNSEGEIVGVNSFGSGGAEGINFAVSADTVKDFLASADSRFAPKTLGGQAMMELIGDCDGTKSVGDSWLSDDESEVLSAFDFTCDGEADAVLSYPRGEGSRYMWIDSTRNGSPDILLWDIENDGSWNLSFYDLDEDGEHDVVGFHSPESGASPESFSSYAKFQAMTNS